MFSLIKYVFDFLVEHFRYFFIYKITLIIIIKYTQLLVSNLLQNLHPKTQGDDSQLISDCCLTSLVSVALLRNQKYGAELMLWHWGRPAPRPTYHYQRCIPKL